MTNDTETFANNYQYGSEGKQIEFAKQYQTSANPQMLPQWLLSGHSLKQQDINVFFPCKSIHSFWHDNLMWSVAFSFWSYYLVIAW